MTAKVREIGPGFGAEIRGFDASRPLSSQKIGFVEAQIAAHGVLVFREQILTDEAQIAFTRNFGALHRSIASNRTDITRAVKSEEISEITNVAADGSIMPRDNASRVQQRANLLWHTDNSFRKPAGAYTLLNARIVPPQDGETEFADMRGAYDALSAEMKSRIADLKVRHDLARSRELAGTGGVFDVAERSRFPPTVQPLVRRHELSGRCAIYLGSHADQIVGWTPKAGRALIAELLAFATQPCFVYRHSWEVGDLVMWDNRITLHRALPFEDLTYRRDMRRTSTMIAPEQDVGEEVAG